MRPKWLEQSSLPSFSDLLQLSLSSQLQYILLVSISTKKLIARMRKVIISELLIIYLCISDSDLDDITSSVDLNEVAETKKTASVKRSKSGTWNVPTGEENASLLGPSNSLRSAPKRTTSTQTLPESEKVFLSLNPLSRRL